MTKINNLCVFTGSSFGNDEKYLKDAKTIAELLKENNIGLVYGGGNKGLMGEIAHRAKTIGVHVIGVLPEAMNIKNVRSRDNEDELIIVKDMHERKKTMYDLSDAFLAMPGGIGTFEELFEIFTWRQLGYHKKNVGLLNSSGFYDGLINFLSDAVRSGFLRKEVLEELIIIGDASKAIEMLQRDAKELPCKL